MRILRQFLLFCGLSLGAEAQQHGLTEAPLDASPTKVFRLPPAPPARLVEVRKRDSERSNWEILNRLRNLEQICVMNSPKEQIEQVKRIDERIHDLRKIIEERAAQLNLVASEAPKEFLNDANTKWSQAEIWRTRFVAQTSARKCEYIELLTGLSISRLSTLAPSKAICRFQDFMCEDPADPLFQRDTRRLSWELRYFLDLDPNILPENPAACRANLIEMQERAKFGKASKTGISRWPLGRAIGMCARPMSAHYLDDDTIKGKIAEPAAWKFQPQVAWDEILDIEEITPRN